MVDSQIYFPKKRILTPLEKRHLKTNLRSPKGDLSLTGLTSLSLFLIWVCLFIFIVAGSFFLENALMLPKKKFFYVPPLDYLKIISGSFRTFCADIFYIRGVLAITEEIENRSTWIDWVQRNFEVATSLDPKLTQGYFFAGVVVARDEQGIKKGIKFLERGIKRNPDEWQIPYWIGFNYYQLGDYLKAIEYYKKASNLPAAPKFLKSIQPMSYYKAERPDLGLMYLEGLLHSIKDPKQLEWIEIKLMWLQNLVYLEEKVEQFKEVYGRWPEGLEELIEVGLLKEIPQDPFGRGYYLDKDSGRVKSKFGLSKEECPKCEEKKRK